MILKEAYRYQNFLDNLISESQRYLMDGNFVTTTKETHNRKKVNDQAEDETIILKKDKQVDFSPMDLVNFMVKVIDEKQTLTDAITTSKRQTKIDIDSAIAMNKVKQSFTTVLGFMARIKSSERQTIGKDYKFDVNGEQKTYNYTIDNVVTIDFDRNAIKKLIKKYNKSADETSAILDELQINTVVDFTPSWDLNDSLEDIICGVEAS